MATYTILPTVKRQFLDNSGNPLSSGKIYTVAAGGTYPADAITVYQTSSGTAHTNPIVLDSAGRISGSSEIYAEPGLSYKLIAAASTSDYTSPLWTQDNIAAVPPSAVNIDIQGTLATNVDAGDLLYLSDGSGAVTAGSWAKADSDNTYSSITPEMGFAVAAGSSGASITIRKGGTIELSGPLSAGSAYYASATAGAITATAPVNARYVGQAQSTTTFVINPELANSATDSVVTDPKVKSVCDGRLTLTTGVPVTSTDVTAATTLYFALYGGNQIGLYNGTRWQQFTIAQLSIAVPATTSTMYDVFVDYNSGTPALAVTAWTNDTTRATALTTQDGVLVLTGTLGKRYVGSFRTTGVSGQTEDSLAKRYVWNYYNRVARPMRVLEATDSWNYTTATFRQANGSTANQLDFVNGVAEDGIEASVYAAFANSNGGVNVVNAIGLDSTSVAATGSAISINAPAAGVFGFNAPSVRTIPAVGRHILTWLEYSVATGTTTFTGDGGGTIVQSGIYGMWRA